MSAHRALQDLLVAPFSIPDPGNGGNIVIDRAFGICEMVSTAAQTRTLAAPVQSGIFCILRQHTDGGDIVLTSAAHLNVAEQHQATFADVGDQLFMVSVKNVTGGGYRWEILVNTGAVALA